MSCSRSRRSPRGRRSCASRRRRSRRPRAGAPRPTQPQPVHVKRRRARCSEDARPREHPDEHRRATQSVDRLSRLARRCRAARRAGRLCAGARLHGDQAVRLRDLGARASASWTSGSRRPGHENAYFPLLIPRASSKRRPSTSRASRRRWPGHARRRQRAGRAAGDPPDLRDDHRRHLRASGSSSYRDLPLLINQWANVVRWEMRTRLFLRTSRVPLAGGPHGSTRPWTEAVRETPTTMLDVYAALSRTTWRCRSCRAARARARSSPAPRDLFD